MKDKHQTNFQKQRKTAEESRTNERAKYSKHDENQPKTNSVYRLKCYFLTLIIHVKNGDRKGKYNTLKNQSDTYFNSVSYRKGVVHFGIFPRIWNMETEEEKNTLPFPF